ncbi:unnamed protein product [Caenorhabditis bovis]|uniref:Ketoreductase domain-containing protein n=1 Tax=Caenorhabditis bovis TaxID=2654633 RepID=A0A8S1FA53_9PELO|nr:unnamed protein product [Caenorhabditis bovis]
MSVKKVAIVTGASSGIGRGAARILAKNGYRVSLTGRNEKALKELAENVKREFGLTDSEIHITAVDLNAPEAPELIVGSTIEKFGQIDTLINSAGILRNGAIIDTGIEVFDELVDVNVRGLIRITRASLPHIIKTKGTVVNVSSITGPCPFAGVAYYCMTKSMVDQFTKCLALEMAPNGVRVNAVNPGVIITNVHRASGLDEKAYAEFLEKCKSTHALGRPGDVEEVAEAILFLATERSSFTTGELLRVDGGRGIMHPR